MTQPQVVAEIGQGKGRQDYIVSAIEEARRAGCWAAKIQLLRPETIAQPDAPVYWDERRPEVDGQRSSFATVGCLGYGEISELMKVARDVGIELIATPFDLDAVDAMASAGMTWCKIASGDITNRPLVEMVGKAFPNRVILSTGAADAGEIKQALDWVREPWAVLACTLAYPTADGDAELGRIRNLDKLLQEKGVSCRVGYSDHTAKPVTAGYAVAAGALVLEKHFTLDRSDRSVPDNSFVLDPAGMADYVRSANDAALFMGRGELSPVPAEEAARIGARRSICAARDLPAGHTVRADDLIMLRPVRHDAFVPVEADSLVGRTTTCSISAGMAILRSAVAFGPTTTLSDGDKQL